MENLNMDIQLTDLGPGKSSILREVLAGLSMGQKMISPKFLYDKRGSEIFEKICLLEEYYPTRSEEEILKNRSKEIAHLIGPHAVLIEPGSGASEKVKILLSEMVAPKGYVPIEISREILLRATAQIHEEFSHVPVMPVCQDFTEDIDLPLSLNPDDKKVVFFPGSTIGNFLPQDAVMLLKKFSKLVGKGGGILIGADLKKDPAILGRAYDDAKGVTAAFNLNLLERLNRELSARFDIKSFRHEARYNNELGRVDMHLVSLLPQQVLVSESLFRFQEGESIHTENSYKYSEQEFEELCAKARLNLKASWKDRKGLFCVYYFEKN